MSLRLQGSVLGTPYQTRLDAVGSPRKVATAPRRPRTPSRGAAATTPPRPPSRRAATPAGRRRSNAGGGRASVTPVGVRREGGTPTPRGAWTASPAASRYDACRFIPDRQGASADLQLRSASRGAENAAPEGEEREGCAPRRLRFQHHMAEALFRGRRATGSVLAFRKRDVPQQTSAEANTMQQLRDNMRHSHHATPRQQRQLCVQPLRVLDLPDMVDDYYLNLLDWSRRNAVAIGLGQRVYLWDADTEQDTVLCEAPEGCVNTSLRFNADGGLLAVAAEDGVVQLWDARTGHHLRDMGGHASRVASMAWSPGGVLCSGSRQGFVVTHDPRQRRAVVARVPAHEGEVCGLEWSPDGAFLAAGGNDNRCTVWDLNALTSPPRPGAPGASPLHAFAQSKAAVKALAWCPWQRGLLATGSGTADRRVRLYSATAGAMVASHDAGAQVCSLRWAPNDRELVTALGYSNNHVTVWRVGRDHAFDRVGDLTGHDQRVLHTALSPDGTTLCSAAADETMMFWKLWERPEDRVALRKDGADRGTPSRRRPFEGVVR